MICLKYVIQTTLVVLFVLACSPQCRHIFTGQKLLVYVCIVHVVATIFDFTTEEDCMSRVEIATLLVGAKVKEGKWGGEGRRFSLPAPSPAPFDSLPFPPLFWSLYMALSQSKTFTCLKIKRLHCRLLGLWKLNLILKQANSPQLEASETSPKHTSIVQTVKLRFQCNQTKQQPIGATEIYAISVGQFKKLNFLTRPDLAVSFVDKTSK